MQLRMQARHVRTTGGSQGSAETRLGPLADGVQVDAAVDERGGQVPAPRLQRVGAQRDGAAVLVGRDQLHRLLRREQREQRVQHVVVVPVVRRQVPLQLQPGAQGTFGRSCHLLEF